MSGEPGELHFAALFDLLVRVDRLHEHAVFSMVADAVTTGVFRGFDRGLFTTAYYRRPSELTVEARKAGFDATSLFSIEGPGFLVHDFAGRWSDPARRKALLDAARLVEQEPEMLAAASHLLLVGALDLMNSQPSARARFATVSWVRTARPRRHMPDRRQRLHRQHPPSDHAGP